MKSITFCKEAWSRRCAQALCPALLLAVGAASIGCESADAPAETTRPNVVLLIADDLGWVDLATGRTNGGRGSRYHETPNIDRLADEGTSFSAAYGFQNCKPARATILTGQHPLRHRVYSTSGFQNAPPDFLRRARIAPPSGDRANLAATTKTLPETLREVGYRSAMIGKVHGFGPPTRARSTRADCGCRGSRACPGS